LPVALSGGSRAKVDPLAGDKAGLSLMTSYSLQSVADAPPNGHVLAKAISSTVDDDPAPPTADTSSAHRSL